MESGALESSAAPGPVRQPVTMACLRRQAWAKSRDSTWQESKPDPQSSQDSHLSPSSSEALRDAEEPGQVPNEITNWLIECRTPLGASLDDQSPSPSKGAQRNGCSFEDDLSLGAEANHMQSENSKPESCVSELLDLYEEDPEEILMNLGFGREEPDLNSKIPARFFNSSSSARGIDIKVYLRAQLQRVELENPSYALTSRFRQIEVLTTVANEFFQLYSQVSGQPVQIISSKDKDETGEGGRTDEQPTSVKKTNSARNVAKILKRTISKHNLLAASSESPEAPAQLKANAKAASEAAPVTNEQGGCNTSTDHKADTVSQKLIRKKDNCSLATVAEESSGDGETESKSHNSPDQGSTVPDQLQSAELLSAEEEEVQELRVEQSVTSTPEKLPVTLAPPKLVQLRNENANSFDMEEIQSNEDENLPPRMSRATDLLRTVSQQSDSSGFAEDPSADSSSYLKVQESSDSCDSETTVTSHPSQDLATPVALKHPTFDLPEVTQEEAGIKDTTEADGRSSSLEKQELNVSSEMIPEYAAHQLPKLSPLQVQRDESQSQDLDPQTTDIVLAAEQELQLDLEDTQSRAVSGQDPENTPNLTETPTDTNLLTETDSAEDTFQEESLFFDHSGLLSPPVPSFQVLNALNRAKQYKVREPAQGLDPQEMTPSYGRGRGRQGMMRLQRSSSLPSSIFSPSTIVSSVKIHVGRGQMSCSQPRYSVKYSKDKEGEEQELQEEEQTNVLSTLIINPSSSGSNKKPPNTVPPEAIPRHLQRSTCSLQSSSPPPVWSPVVRPDSWSTQSVPNYFSSQQSLGQFSHLKMNQNQQSWTPGQTMFPHQNPSSQYSEQSSCPSLISSQYSSSMFPDPQYPSPVPPYASLPNLVSHHSSLPGLQHPATPPVHPHNSMSSLHHPSTTPRHVNLSLIHPGTPTMHHQGYNHPYPHHTPYHTAPHGQQFPSPHMAYQGYSNTLLAIPNPVLNYPQMPSDHTHYQNPLNTGFIPGQDSIFGPSHSLYLGPTPPAAPGPGSSQVSSSTEMQLRRVLHEIRGTVQSLSEIQADTPDTFSQHRTASSYRQTLAEFQRKRRNLNLFRRQMMDLELSIIQQQALVYHQLGPADRLEVENLQALRCNIREELAELEQQLEEKLMELIDITKHRDLHSNSSVDDLSTISALRTMEPVSDLLNEQLFLRSELGYDDRDRSANVSTRSSSPVRAAVRGGGQKHKLFRTSVDITPVLPPRPNAHTPRGEGGDGEENVGDGKEKGGKDSGAAAEGRGTNGEDVEEDGASTRVRVDNLQQLIQEIRDSVAQEIRQEIYNELLAAVTPPQPSSSTRQRPL
ncbi:protein ITPRID2 isoform X3 [Gouania willdenowi]|nr:protein ITPRID2 isoform X3 [Gouania willdenowi]